MYESNLYSDGVPPPTPQGHTAQRPQLGTSLTRYETLQKEHR